MFTFMQPPAKINKISAGEKKLLKLTSDFIDSNEAEPIKILVRFWKDQAMVLTYKEIREWIEQGDVTTSVLQQWSADYVKVFHEKLKPYWVDASEKGFAQHPFFERMNGTDFVYNPQRAGTLQYIENHTADLVTRTTEEQRQAIKDVIALGWRDNMGSDELSRLIRPMVGLNSRQAAANKRYYETAKKQIADAHPRMKTENVEAKARHMAQMYGEKQHRYRAQTIAQTELHNAYEAGSYFGIQEAQNEGYIGEIKKQWVTAAGEINGVCKACVALEGVTIGLTEYFTSEKFAPVLRPELHPRCRCTLKYIEVEDDDD